MVGIKEIISMLLIVIVCILDISVVSRIDFDKSQTF
jgi:hypothetical protein